MDADALILEVIESHNDVQRMELSGERPCIDDERAIYARRDNAIAALGALVVGLKRIANHPANITGAPDMERIARQSLAQAGISP